MTEAINIPANVCPYSMPPSYKCQQHLVCVKNIKASRPTAKYHKSKSSWDYINIASVDYFLDDWRDVLTEENISQALRQCIKYRDESCTEYLTLNFGEMTLRIKGVDEACSVIRGLEVWRI